MRHSSPIRFVTGISPRNRCRILVNSLLIRRISASRLLPNQEECRSKLSFRSSPRILQFRISEMNTAKPRIASPFIFGMIVGTESKRSFQWRVN